VTDPETDWPSSVAAQCWLASLREYSVRRRNASSFSVWIVFFEDAMKLNSIVIGGVSSSPSLSTETENMFTPPRIRRTRLSAALRTDFFVSETMR